EEPVKCEGGRMGRTKFNPTSAAHRRPRGRAMKRFLIALASVSAATAAFGYFAGPYLDVLPPICPFRILTGRRCVFCGMSHALAFAVRGDFVSAGTAHPVWFIALPLFIVFAAAILTKRARLSWSLVCALVLGTFWTATL